MRSTTSATGRRAASAARWITPTIAPWLSSRPCTVRRYHWIVPIGSLPLSLSVATRLTRLIPSRCRPIATPPNSTFGILRVRHTGQCLAVTTCSVTCTADTGISITSRVRCVHPPERPVPQSGQMSTACSRRSVGSMRRRPKPWDLRFLGLSSTLGRRPGPGLLPGIPRGPPPPNRDSNCSTRRCNSAMRACCSELTACCSAMIAKRPARLAALRSTSVSTPPVSHDHRPWRQRLLPHLLDHSLSSNVNSYRRRARRV